MSGRHRVSTRAGKLAKVFELSGQTCHRIGTEASAITNSVQLRLKI